MNMKKSLIAVAVAGACAVPMAAMADAGAYGRINIAIQSQGGDVADSAEELSLFSASSRFGFMGEEDLGNGLTAMYRYEFAVDATEADVSDNDRLSWVGLSGDFGTIKAGKMWSAWYNYIGWITDRSQYLGGPAYYYSVNAIGATTRASDTIQYTFGGGGYSSDPFTFTVEAQMDPVGLDSDANGDDPQNFDILTVAGAGTFGPVTVSAAFRSSSSSQAGGGAAEPGQTAVGVEWGSGPLYIGGSYIMTDPDGASGAEPSGLGVLATYDFGGGLSGQLGFGTADADNDDDESSSSVFVQLNKALSDRTNAYVEVLGSDVDAGDTAGGQVAEDASTQTILVGLGHSF